MADKKTKKNNDDVLEFIESLQDQKKKSEAVEILTMMKKITGEDPVMWGSSIIGFGDTSYTTADNKVHKWMKIGYSPRKAYHSFYQLRTTENGKEFEGLGKYKLSKGCLYINKLEDIDKKFLEKLIAEGWKHDSFN